MVLCQHYASLCILGKSGDLSLTFFLQKYKFPERENFSANAPNPGVKSAKSGTDIGGLNLTEINAKM